jgi:hypothetical protein
MATNITFRTQLLGGVAEFCTHCGLPLVANPLNLVELVVALARYREEGVKLNPQVYVSNDIGSLTAMLPNGERLKIGGTTANIPGIREALKKTAPLASNGWAIYLEQQNQLLEYGVFRGSSNPLAVAIDDVLLKDIEPLSVVKVFNVAEECVEVRASNGRFHHVFLDHRGDDSPPPLQFLDALLGQMTQSCKQEDKEEVAVYLKKLLGTAMRESHGCLIAVSSMKGVPSFLAEDGVVLNSPIDFAQLVANLKRGKIEPSMLESKGALLKGMLGSDGIIVFDKKARLLGYNCFVKVKDQAAGVVGGARKRAFATLSRRVGNGLSAAYIQSQDGATDFVEL